MLLAYPSTLCSPFMRLRVAFLPAFLPVDVFDCACVNVYAAVL